MTRELQGAIERARRSGDPHDSLIVARLCREERELMESLHWYRFYLAARRDDRAARREMQQVLKLQPLQEQAEKAISWATRVAYRLDWSDTLLLPAINQLRLDLRKSALKEFEAVLVAQLRAHFGLTPRQNPWRALLDWADLRSDYDLAVELVPLARVPSRRAEILQQLSEAQRETRAISSYARRRHSELLHLLQNAVCNGELADVSRYQAELLGLLRDELEDDDDRDSPGLAARKPPPSPRGGGEAKNWGSSE